MIFLRWKHGSNDRRRLESPPAEVKNYRRKDPMQVYAENLMQAQCQVYDQQMYNQYYNKMYEAGSYYIPSKLALDRKYNQENKKPKKRGRSPIKGVRNVDELVNSRSRSIRRPKAVLRPNRGRSTSIKRNIRRNMPARDPNDPMKGKKSLVSYNPSRSSSSSSSSSRSSSCSRGSSCSKCYPKQKITGDYPPRAAEVTKIRCPSSEYASACEKILKDTKVDDQISDTLVFETAKNDDDDDDANDDIIVELQKNKGLDNLKKDLDKFHYKMELLNEKTIQIRGNHSRKKRHNQCLFHSSSFIGLT